MNGITVGFIFNDTVLKFLSSIFIVF
jgi:hypothetical protein